CTHYATAFVLMARSLGLTARYAEGYSPDITSMENVFAVKDSSSHAYPEVYIQNMGWIVFEPTVASDYNRLTSGETNSGGGFNITIDYSLVFVICIISGAVLVIALILIFTIPEISEKCFVRRINEMPPEECIKQVYLRISGKTVSGIVKRADALTPYELSARIEHLTGCETGDFAYIAEMALFDGNADEAGKQKACTVYTDVRDSVRKYVKEQKKFRRIKFKMKGRSRNDK
ncbi:MAG: transglutaminase family protein, partial [Huintestinicola sp.]